MVPLVPAAMYAGMGGMGGAAGSSMLSSMLPGLVAGGFGLGGGMFSASSNKRAIDRQTQLTERMAREGLQWRVADAKKAGLHPLFALGFNPGTNIPMVMGDTVGPAMAEMGQHLARGIERMQGSEANELAELNKLLMKSQIAETDARTMAIHSDIARQNQNKLIGGLGLQQEGPIEGQVPAKDVINVKPVDVDVSKKDYGSIIAGTHPTYQISELTSGLPLMHYKLQGESLSEMLESMSWYDKLGMINQNTRMFGPRWPNDFVGWQLFGITPKNRYTLGGKQLRAWDYDPQLLTGDQIKSMKREVEKWIDAPRRYLNKPFFKK